MPEPRHPLDHLIDAAGGEAGGLTLRSVREATCAHVLARAETAGAVAAALGAGTAVRTVARTEDGLGFWCVAPGRWWAVAETGRSAGIAADLADRIAGEGYVSDQSAARVLIRITGPRWPDLLAKGCGLRPDTIRAATCAQTQIAHVSAALAGTPDGTGMDWLVPSGFAISLWEWLETATAVYRPAVIAR